MAALAIAKRCGRPPMHPIPEDLYKLVATNLLVIVMEVVEDEVHCRYATSEEEAHFSVNWLRGHADLQYKRRSRMPDVPVATEFTDISLIGAQSANTPC